jgi:hypothetical protein
MEVEDKETKRHTVDRAKKTVKCQSIKDSKDREEPAQSDDNAPHVSTQGFARLKIDEALPRRRRNGPIRSKDSSLNLQPDHPTTINTFPRQ